LQVRPLPLSRSRHPSVHASAVSPPPTRTWFCPCAHSRYNTMRSLLWFSSILLVGLPFIEATRPVRRHLDHEGPGRRPHLERRRKICHKHFDNSTSVDLSVAVPSNPSSSSSIDDNELVASFPATKTSAHNSHHTTHSSTSAAKPTKSASSSKAGTGLSSSNGKSSGEAVTTDPSCDPIPGTGPFSGDMTWFATGLGACGITNTDTDMICAVSHVLFDSWIGANPDNPNTNPICGKKISLTVPGASEPITVTVVDRCTGCACEDLDLTPTAFGKLAPTSVGRVHGMTWNWVD